MTDLADHLSQVTNTATIEELWALHCARMADFGFDRLFYGFTRHRTESSLGDPDDMLLLTNHPTDYASVFIERGYYRHAPMVRWALANEGACSWNWMGDPDQLADLTEGELEVIEFNRSMGIRAGFSISFKSVNARSKGAIALTARSELGQDEVDALWAEHGRDILLMNNVAHLKLLTLPYSGRRTLTPRQREVLEWAGDGKAVLDIALLLEVSPATVEKHLRLAREALAVETTAQAVLKASLHNQIFVLES